MWTPRASRSVAEPVSANSLDGDTLLSTPVNNLAVKSSRSTAPKRHPTTSGRIEKTKPAKSTSIASKIIGLLNFLPSPKRTFFTGTNPLKRITANPSADNQPDISTDSDEAVSSIETASNPDVGGDDMDADSAGDPWDTDQEEEEEERTDWREEQMALNIVLRARHEFTLLPSTWKYNLRGIPIPDTLFYTKTKTKSMRPRIYAIQDRFEYQGETAFRRLIDVHAQIRDLRKVQVEINSDRTLSIAEKESRHGEVSAAITSKISRAIERACVWAETDADLRGLRNQAPPNIMIAVLRNTEEHGDVFIQENMDNLARKWRQKLGIPEAAREESVVSGSEWDEEEGDTTIKVEEDDDNALSRDPSEQRTPKAQSKASAGNQATVDPDDQIKAPVLFGFVIFKHTLMIVTLDANDPTAPCNIPISLNMAESNQHQWNALAIMVTICWARDLLARVVQEIDLEKSARMPSEDPDA